MVSIPSISGIAMSMRIRSGYVLCKIFNASPPGWQILVDNFLQQATCPQSCADESHRHPRPGPSAGCGPPWHSGDAPFNVGRAFFPEFIGPLLDWLHRFSGRTKAWPDFVLHEPIDLTLLAGDIPDLGHVRQLLLRELAGKSVQRDANLLFRLHHAAIDDVNVLAALRHLLIQHASQLSKATRHGGKFSRRRTTLHDGGQIA